jgi:hypothetical protein
VNASENQNRNKNSSSTWAGNYNLWTHQRVLHDRVTREQKG